MVHRKGQESPDHTAYFVYLDSALPISSTHLLDQYAPHVTPDTLRDQLTRCITQQEWIPNTPGSADLLTCTQEAIEAYLFVRFCNQLIRHTHRQQARQAENQTKHELALQQQQAHENEVKERVKRNQSISGDDLLTLSRQCGITIPLRTQGYLSKHVREITNTRYSTTGRTIPKVSPSQYYQRLRASLCTPHSRVA